MRRIHSPISGEIPIESPGPESYRSGAQKERRGEGMQDNFRQSGTRRPGSDRRVPGGIWVVLVLLLALPLSAALAQPSTTAISSPKRGQALSPDELPRDMNGRPVVDVLPNVQPRRAVDSAHKVDLESLKDERDRIVESSRNARRLVEVPDPPPDDAEAPIDAAGAAADPDPVLP